MPFLAAIDEDYQIRTNLNHLSEIAIWRALGFYLTTKSPRQQYSLINHLSCSNIIPLWYQYVVREYPEAVADSLVLVHNANVCSKNPPHPHMYEMAFDLAMLT